MSSVSKFAEFKERYSELEYNPFATPVGTYLSSQYPQLRGLISGMICADDDHTEVTARQMDIMCRFTLLMYQRLGSGIEERDYKKRIERCVKELADFGLDFSDCLLVKGWVLSGFEPWPKSVAFCAKLLDPNSFALWVSMKSVYANQLAIMATDPQHSVDPIKLVSLQQNLQANAGDLVSKLAAMEKSMFGSGEMARAASAGEMLDGYYAEQNLQEFDNKTKFKP